jgi:hypothetical protein
MSSSSREAGDPNRIGSICHAPPTQSSRETQDGSETGSGISAQVVVPQKPSTVVVAPEEIDPSAEERAYTPDKRVKFTNGAAEQGAFAQPVSSPSSLERAAGHLRHCRLVLMHRIPVIHPIWSRVRVDGGLGEDDSESCSDETIEVDGSDSDDSSGGVPAAEGGDWWDELDEADAKQAIGEAPVVSPVEEGAKLASQDGEEDDVSSEEE